VPPTQRPNGCVFTYYIITARYTTK